MVESVIDLMVVEYLIEAVVRCLIELLSDVVEGAGVTLLSADVQTRVMEHWIL